MKQYDWEEARKKRQFWKRDAEGVTPAQSPSPPHEKEEEPSPRPKRKGKVIWWVLEIMLTVLLLSIVLLRWWMGSVEAELESPEVVQETPAEDKRWAILIGIEKYAGIGNDLNYCVDDTVRLKETLVKHAHFPEEQVFTLTDKEASAANIRSVLDLLEQHVGENDFVIVSFSGHGGTDGEHNYYLCPTDITQNTLPMRELTQRFNRIKANRLLFMVDACHSGAMDIESPALANFNIKAPSQMYWEEFLQSEGRLALNSCRASETSLENPKLGAGVFTYQLCEGMAGKGDANGDGIVSLMECYEYIASSVPQMAENIISGHQQHPVLRGDLSGTFPLAAIRNSSESESSKGSHGCMKCGCSKFRQRMDDSGICQCGHRWGDHYFYDYSDE